MRERHTKRAEVAVSFLFAFIRLLLHSSGRLQDLKGKNSNCSDSPKSHIITSFSHRLTGFSCARHSQPGPVGFLRRNRQGINYFYDLRVLLIFFFPRIKVTRKLMIRSRIEVSPDFRKGTSYCAHLRLVVNGSAESRDGQS